MRNGIWWRIEIERCILVVLEKFVDGEATPEKFREMKAEVMNLSIFKNERKDIVEKIVDNAIVIIFRGGVYG